MLQWSKKHRNRTAAQHATLLALTAVLVTCAAAAAQDSDGAAGYTDRASANAAMELDLSQVSPPSGETHGSKEPPPRPALAGADAATGYGERVPIQRPSVEADRVPDRKPWYRSGLVPLLAVLGVIAAMVLLARRFVKGGHAPRGDVLQVLARTHLSPKQSIALVQMGGRLVFVGITPESIARLRTVADGDEAAWLRGRLRLGVSAAEQAEFDRLLNTEGAALKETMTRQSELPIEPTQRVAQTRRNLRGLLDQLKSHRKAYT